MKATATPAEVIPSGYYVCNRCGRIVVDTDSRNLVTCRDCRTIEADLADPARIAKLDRRLDGPPARTHCDNGHEYTEDTTKLDSRGWLQCRICKAQTDRAYLERNRAVINARRRKRAS